MEQQSQQQGLQQQQSQQPGGSARPMASQPQPAPSAASGRRVIGDADLKRMRAEAGEDVLGRNWYQLATLALIVVNVAVYLVEVVLSGLSLDISSRVLVSMGAMYAPAVTSPADLYRLVTPMFLHLDLMHLAFNMVALYSVGVLLENVLGKGNFLLLYFVGGVTGNALTLWLDSASSAATVSAGASTSIFGLFVAVALLGVLHREGRRLFREYSKGMLGVIAANVLYTLLVPGISVVGHLGGALGGLIGMILVPARSLRVPKVLRAVAAAVWVAAVAFLVVGAFGGGA